MFEHCVMQGWETQGVPLEGHSQKDNCLHEKPIIKRMVTISTNLHEVGDIEQGNTQKQSLCLGGAHTGAQQYTTAYSMKLGGPSTQPVHQTTYHYVPQWGITWDIVTPH